MKEQKTIRKTLKKLGVESYLRGYAYLFVAIDERIRNPEKGVFAKLWYEEMAEMHSLPIENVFKAVELAISVADEKQTNLYQQLFKELPSSRDFIEKTVEYLTSKEEKE